MDTASRIAYLTHENAKLRTAYARLLEAARSIGCMKADCAHRVLPGEQGQHCAQPCTGECNCKGEQSRINEFSTSTPAGG